MTPPARSCRVHRCWHDDNAYPLRRQACVSEKPISVDRAGTVAIESRVDDVRLVAEDLRTGPFQCRCIRSVLKVRFE